MKLCIICGKPMLGPGSGMCLGCFKIHILKDKSLEERNKELWDKLLGHN